MFAQGDDSLDYNVLWGKDAGERLVGWGRYEIILMSRNPP